MNRSTPSGDSSTASDKSTANTASAGDRIAEVADRVFGWPQLRPGQAAAIEAVVRGDDVLAVMPTGYGKSAVYQVAGHLVDGPTVVVSPLISLQVDQVQHIRERTGDDEAVAVNSGQSKRANSEAWEAVASGEAEFLFLAPEQFAREEVIEELTTLGVGLFVVDEAHCVSAWGHDFRPDYLRLGGVIERLGGPRILAMTATGSAPVREEIVERLGMREPRVLVHGFDRPNIHLSVVRHESEADKQRAVRDQVASLMSPGLVYVATRGETESLAGELAERRSGLRTGAYHAGLRVKERNEVHERFQAGELDVVVATSAFGMGIDKPDVRFVVHGDITDSIDSYYQEVGRGGRDGEPATATLHYRQEDLGLRSFFASGHPENERVRSVVRALAPRGRRRRLPMAQVAEESEVPPRGAENIVNLLIAAGVADENEDGVSLTRRITQGDAIDAVREAADRRRRIDESRLAMVRAYAETLGCRRQFLLGYFGDEPAEPCGNCDTCDSGSAYRRAEEAVSEAVSEAPFGEGDRVSHASWGEGAVVSVEADRLTVFFESEGYKVLSLGAVEENGLLTELSA